MSDTSLSSIGSGYLVVLTIVFIIMKLACVGAVCGWSWWWVLSPIWISTLIVITVLLIIVFFAVINDKFN